MTAKPSPLQLGLLGFISAHGRNGEELYFPRANSSRAAEFGLMTENWARVAENCRRKGYVTIRLGGLVTLTDVGRAALMGRKS